MTARIKAPEHLVIVAGSRGFSDYQMLRGKLDNILGNLDPEVTAIVSGTARGADQMGERYAEERMLKLVRMPADWDTHGKRAGYLRNEEMAKIATHCVVFWDGKSPGTQHMINLAEKHGLKVRIVRY